MTDDEQQRVKNPFAIPMSALVGDGGVAHEQLVTLQPHQQHTDWVPSVNDVGGGGNGDGDGD
jgi:hypothetical protein